MLVRLKHLAGVTAIVAAGVSFSESALADPDDEDSPGSPEVSVRSETHFQLYRRALLPGPYGASVTTQSAVPVIEYASLYASEIDAPWQKRALDVELDVWGSATFGEAGEDRRIDGDVRAAYVRYRSGLAWAKVGRQVFAGGAARFARFDGLSAGGTLPFGLGAEAYAGLTVLPRWNAQPGYEHLGSATDSLLRDPDALEDPSRGGYWLAGGRVFYDSSKLDAGVSFHEQHENDELGHRRLGLDARYDILEALSAGGNANLDLDSERVADGRIYAEFAPSERYSLDVEASHAEPSLFLSRQSVLSVFTTESYQEAGGTVSYKPWHVLRLTAGGFGQHYSSDGNGGRGEVAAKVTPDRSGRTLVLLSYTRVLATDNGYHSVRTSLRQRIVSPLVATAEGYLYFYDDSIRGHDSSSVFAGTLEYGVLPELGVLGGASVARSPYALSDVQAQLRVVYGPKRGAWR